MELFYSTTIENGICLLPQEESIHCAKVLRHSAGDSIKVIDGMGNLYTCRIIECGKQVVCSVEDVQTKFGEHNYNLTMAVCPTKNIDRYEWFLEKATELGVDTIVPVVGEHSERKTIKEERLQKILVSAAKQSLKGTVPVLEKICTVKQFIQGSSADNRVKLIAYCGNAAKISLEQAISKAAALSPDKPGITILIGPEGDFSPGEVETAMAAGYMPLTLGESRLRTETAAVAAVSGVYFMCK